MAKVTTRQELIDYGLRKLGFPVISINVDDDQIEDRLDDTFQIWADYHFDGTEKQHYLHTITQQDIDNEFIPIPDSILFVEKILNHGSFSGMPYPFGNPRYSWTDFGNNPLSMATSTTPATSSINDHADSQKRFDLTGYVMSMKNYALIEQLFSGGGVPIRFNRHTNKLYLDTDWKSEMSVGQVVVVEALTLVDPETYPDVYNDRWIKKYFPALLKQQWGQNLKKFGGIQLPGGVTLNADSIYQEATQEIEKLEDELQEKYELPPLPFMR